MKAQKKIIFILLLIFPILFVSCSDDDNKEVTNIVLNQYRIELDVAETFSLIATVKPESASNKIINWESENNAIATVNNNGKVTAVQPGETSIIAKIDNKKVICKVIVKTAENNVSIYAVGGHPNENAKVWKDGKLLYDLPGAEIAYSVYVVGNDVYTAGGHPKAKVWKNGTLLYDLPEGDVAYSIFVKDTDVFVAGKSADAHAKIWKNGALLYNLSDGKIAYSVYIDGTDVYVCGNGVNVAKVWKNGNLLYDLPGGIHAQCIYIENGDLYVAGGGKYGAISIGKVWKNGELLYEMEGTSVFSSIYVVGTNVYVVGPVTGVWKNDALLYDDFEGRSPQSIFVKGNDIYIAGGTNSTSGLIWKNGTLLYTFPHSNTSALRGYK